jgi:hypothetical protein
LTISRASTTATQGDDDTNAVMPVQKPCKSEPPRSGVVAGEREGDGVGTGTR